MNVLLIKRSALEIERILQRKGFRSKVSAGNGTRWANNRVDITVRPNGDVLIWYTTHPKHLVWSSARQEFMDRGE